MKKLLIALLIGTFAIFSLALIGCGDEGDEDVEADVTEEEEGVEDETPEVVEEEEVGEEELPAEEAIEEGEETVEEASKQTKDIHQFVPFVGWLSYAAASLPKRFLPGSAWQGKIEDQEGSSSSSAG